MEEEFKSHNILHRIAFGACNNQDKQNKLWPIIESRRPAAFVWGGDAIYADVQRSSFPFGTTVECATPDRLRHLYRKQRALPDYRRLLETNLTVFGTFDDHDYGCNNADRTYEFKHESGLAFVDFIDVSENSAMRKRAENGYGVYGVKLFDFARSVGNQEVPEYEANLDADIALGPHTYKNSNKTVAVFVLDVRTNKTPWKTGFDRYLLDFDGDYLGERQWQWFEQSISRSRASVNIIVNGLQIHARRFPDGNVAESWAQYPRAQQRLFDILLQDFVESPILISGDVHMSQLSRKVCARKGENQPSRSLIEMTTSGMTHSWGTISKPISNLDYKASWSEWYHWYAARSMIRILHKLCPWTDVMDSALVSDQNNGLYENGAGEGSTAGLQYSLEMNFGELEFDWDERTVSMRVMGIEKDAPPLLMAKFSMDQLSGRDIIANSDHLMAKDFQNEAQMTLHQLYNSNWVCINHRGRDTMDLQIIGYVSSALVLVGAVALPIILPVILLLQVARQWSSSGGRYNLYSKQGDILQKRRTKRERLSKLLPTKCRSVFSITKHTRQDFKNLSRVKLSQKGRGVLVSKIVRFKACDREMPQFQ